MNQIFVTPFKYPNSTLFRKIFYCDSDIIFFNINQEVNNKVSQF